MREQHKINGSNIPRLRDTTVALLKVQILLFHVIIGLVQPTHSQNTVTFSVNTELNGFKLIWFENYIRIFYDCTSC